MSLVRRIRRNRGEIRASSFPAITSLEDLARVMGLGSTTSLTSAGTIDGALSAAAVWRSVNKIAGIVAQTPWHSRRGRKVVDPQPPLLIHPSVMFARPSVWRRTAVTSMLLGGGVTALVNDPEHPTKLELVPPDDVDWTEQRGWTIVGTEYVEWPAGPLWHVPYMTLPGSPKGIGPLEYARRTTYASLAAKEFGGNFFRDGAHPTTVIAPKDDPGEDGAEELKRRFRRSISGTDRDPIVVPQAIEWHQIQINPEDSQFLDLMGFTGGEIAGFFGLMPEHIGYPVQGGSSVQYSNRENRQQDLLQDAVMPVLLPLEEGITEVLPRGQRLQFNVAGLLRADLKTRYESYKLAAEVQEKTGSPFLTADEMRELEDREPIAQESAQ